MTSVCYDGTHWSTQQLLFRALNHGYGPLANWHGQNFGASSAYAFLGPDIEAPGGNTTNPPQATGAGWDLAWPHAPPVGAGPAVPFIHDGANVWIRGHLINAEWGGSGTSWSNLAPLTSQSNANHKTIETRMKVYLQNFHAFDTSGRQPYWYAIHYWVQASTDPWSFADTVGDLYSYCPNMVKVTWRIVRLNKPVGAPGTSAGTFTGAVPGWLAGNAAGAAPATTLQIQGDLPNMPVSAIAPTGVLTNTPANVGEIGGAVHPLPVGAPAIPPATNAWDGAVEVFQN